MPNGRPSSYTEEAADLICAALAEGKTMAQACAPEVCPARSTVYYWMEQNDAFRSRIARAREIGQDATVDDCREIVDNATPEDWQVARLRVWHRQWEAAKRAPKQFGEKITQEHTGEIVTHVIKAR